MDRVIEQLRAHWAGLGCLNAKVASERDIRAFEARHAVRLSPSIRTYFSVLNGTREGRCGMEDEDLISFWHLDEVQTLAVECPSDPTPEASRLFVFADWSIWAHAWAVRLTDDPDGLAPVVITYHTSQQVAPSFDEFLERYVARDRNVLFPAPASEYSRT